MPNLKPQKIEYWYTKSGNRMTQATFISRITMVDSEGSVCGHVHGFTETPIASPADILDIHTNPQNVIPISGRNEFEQERHEALKGIKGAFWGEFVF